MKFECTLWYDDIDEFMTTKETACVVMEIRAPSYRTAECMALHLQAKLSADDCSFKEIVES